VADSEGARASVAEGPGVVTRPDLAIRLLEGGGLRVEHVRTARLFLNGHEQPPTEQELRDQILLGARDAGGDEPVVIFSGDGTPSLDWSVAAVAADLARVVVAEGARERRALRARTRPKKAKAKKEEQPVELPEARPSGGPILDGVFSAGRWRWGDDDRGDSGHGSVAAFSIPRAALARLRAHAEEAHRERPGFESVGCLVVDDVARRVLRYCRLRNWAERPNEFQVMGRARLSRGPHRNIVVHSHPLSPARPSPEDVAGAVGDTAGIFSLLSGELTLWTTTRPNWAPIPFTIVA
jgi:proteasome lid subunit RPN8/RPN11